MQRLIKDASQLTDVQKELGVTVDENDMSFANIANAISVVQKNMGIMGTTAEEAEDTIQGSAYSFRASWQNLLTGMADDNADFEGLIQTFIESLMGMLDNMLPRIMQVVEGMGDMIGAFIEEILPKLIDQLVPFVEKIVPEVADLIVNNLPIILDAGIQLILALANGLIEALPTIIEMLPELVMQLAKVIIKNAPKILSAGMDLVKALGRGISRAMGVARSAMVSVGNAIWSAIKAFPSKMISAGLDLVKGIWQGISNGYSWIKGKITTWVGNVTDFIKNLFGIESPSKLMRDEVGKNLALGIGVGFSDTMSDVANQMGDAIPKSFDVDATLQSASQSQDNPTVRAFKQALSEMKIELDSKVAGKFVETKVTRLIYQ